MLHSINHEQSVYVLKSGNGFSCLGFDVVSHYINVLCQETGERFEHADQVGTETHYYIYVHLVNTVREMNRRNGFRSKAGLNPKLIGLEGKRIECLLHGERTRFIVGRSTGWIPGHLEIKTRRSTGGCGITFRPDDIQNIKVVN